MEVIRLSGDELTRYLPALARLRIEVFRSFPYLYQGDAAYEERYLSTYQQSDGSVVVLAIDDGEVVGASTAIPMRHETEEVTAPFEDAGFAIDRLFYLGESVLLPAYRGQGIGVAFFDHREAHAREIGDFDHFCFCAVDRPPHHPARPADYQGLDRFWQQRGYTRHPELTTHFSWQDVGDTEESRKPMTFWMKPA